MGTENPTPNLETPSDQLERMREAHESQRRARVEKAPSEAEEQFERMRNSHEKQRAERVETPPSDLEKMRSSHEKQRREIATQAEVANNRANEIRERLRREQLREEAKEVAVKPPEDSKPKVEIKEEARITRKEPIKKPSLLDRATALVFGHKPESFELYKKQEQERKREEKATKMVHGARTLDGLEQAIQSIGSIKGGSKEFSSEDIIRIIGRVQKGELSSQYITRTYGIREKYEELYRIQFEKKNREYKEARNAAVKKAAKWDPDKVPGEKWTETIENAEELAQAVKRCENLGQLIWLVHQVGPFKKGDEEIEVGYVMATIYEFAKMPSKEKLALIPDVYSIRDQAKRLVVTDKRNIDSFYLPIGEIAAGRQKISKDKAESKKEEKKGGFRSWFRRNK